MKLVPRAAIQLHLRTVILASVAHKIILIVFINREHYKYEYALGAIVQVLLQ